MRWETERLVGAGKEGGRQRQGRRRRGEVRRERDQCAAAALRRV